MKPHTPRIAKNSINTRLSTPLHVFLKHDLDDATSFVKTRVVTQHHRSSNGVPREKVIPLTQENTATKLT
jgi:hypothetical protein